MHSFPRVRMLALSAMALFGALGCKQAIGQPCEYNGDCTSGAVCCGANLSSAASYRRGLCYAMDTFCPSSDAGAAPDASLEAGMSSPEAGVMEAGMPDSGPVIDAGTDAGSPADAGTDAGTTDAGTDAGGAADAGADASVDGG